MREKNFHSLFWDKLDHLKTKYLTLDQHLVVDKNLWASTSLKSVWEDIPRDSEGEILKDKVVSITCRAIGFPQKLLPRLFFSKEGSSEARTSVDRAHTSHRRPHPLVLVALPPLRT